MSVAAGIWRHPLLRSARARAAEPMVVPTTTAAAGSPLEPLVRQLFFSGGVQRARVSFVSTGPETDAGALAADAARVLLNITCGTVAVVDSHAGPGLPESPKKPQAEIGHGSWRSNEFQIGDRLWRVPADLLAQEPTPRRLSTHLDSGSLPFDYVLFAAQVKDSIFPMLRSYCDGAVLVLTANQTRRESALHAKMILQQCGIELHGTVLQGRQLPIPESIYQRL
ncbi:MAG TPA: hypothetical protein VGU90_06620 [Terriglobales bacterium]|nr:hypothetical protein [Terriglobales bacterium]